MFVALPALTCRHGTVRHCLLRKVIIEDDLAQGFANVLVSVTHVYYNDYKKLRIIATHADTECGSKHLFHTLFLLEREKAIGALIGRAPHAS